MWNKSNCVKCVFFAWPVYAWPVHFVANDNHNVAIVQPVLVHCCLQRAVCKCTLRHPTSTLNSGASPGASEKKPHIYSIQKEATSCAATSEMCSGCSLSNLGSPHHHTTRSRTSCELHEAGHQVETPRFPLCGSDCTSLQDANLFHQFSTFSDFQAVQASARRPPSSPAPAAPAAAAHGQLGHRSHGRRKCDRLRMAEVETSAEAVVETCLEDEMSCQAGKAFRW